MDAYQELVGTLALAMGAAWASGVNLYLVILVLGIGGQTGTIAVPESMALVQSPLVIAVAGVLFFVEFFADKIPGVDSAWDAIHTFIRVPAGCILAASAVAEVSPELQIAVGLIGAGLAGASHAAKAGSRVVLNASPEPISNWTASVVEDLAVVAALWTTLNFPLIMLGLLILFIGFVIWLLPRLWGVVKALFRRLSELLGRR